MKLIVAFFTEVSFPAVLQELLPLVLSFELPAIMQSDPNSPTVQHISQTYNLAVSFKPPTRLYRATGVVRGSQNNASAVKVSAGGKNGSIWSHDNRVQRPGSFSVKNVHSRYAGFLLLRLVLLGSKVKQELLHPLRNLYAPPQSIQCSSVYFSTLTLHLSSRPRRKKNSFP